MRVGCGDHAARACRSSPGGSGPRVYTRPPGKAVAEYLELGGGARVAAAAMPLLGSCALGEACRTELAWALLIRLRVWGWCVKGTGGWLPGSSFLRPQEQMQVKTDLALAPAYMHPGLFRCSGWGPQKARPPQHMLHLCALNFSIKFTLTKPTSQAPSSSSSSPLLFWWPGWAQATHFVAECKAW